MPEIDLSEFCDLPDTSQLDIVDGMMAEHQRIITEADDLERLCLALLDDKSSFKLDDWLYKVRFIRTYADAAHHRKEEDILYAYLLENVGGPAESLVRHGMLVDHDRGRFCVRNMEQAALQLDKSGDDSDRLELIAWAMEYVHMIRAHVEREDKVVYPFARRTVPADVMARLTDEAHGYVADPSSR
ncbi:MAG: hemerythrin domain-containing protein [Coriobacteriales bacterium]|nr:hemerythrin domain-containing protein [Coriobacteriales bacterium]